MAENVLIIPEETGVGGFPFLGTTGFGTGDSLLLATTEPGTGGSVGGLGLLGLLLPALLLASLLPGLIPMATTLAPAPACPVCAAPITCPAPCVPTPTCPDGFMKLMRGATTIPNKCYLFLTTPKTFLNQLQTCNINGGTLSNPMNEDEGLAIRTFLQTNYPNTEFYFGYSDLGNMENLIALSGGPNPVPGLGVNAATNVNGGGETDCTAITVSVGGIATAETPMCFLDRNAVCEVNLSAQRCVCP